MRFNPNKVSLKHFQTLLSLKPFFHFWKCYWNYKTFVKVNATSSSHHAKVLGKLWSICFAYPCVLHLFKHWIFIMIGTSGELGLKTFFWTGHECSFLRAFDTPHQSKRLSIECALHRWLSYLWKLHACLLWQMYDRHYNWRLLIRNSHQNEKKGREGILWKTSNMWFQAKPGQD